MKVRKLIKLLLAASLLVPTGLLLGEVPSVEAAYDPSAQRAMIANGQTYSLFVQKDGTVKASGFEASTGAMGQGSFSSSTYSTSIKVPGLTSAIQVAAFGYSSYALLSDGTVMSWGQNTNGQLGLGHATNVHTPTIIPNLSNVKQIVAGNGFAVALLHDGTLTGWGLNDYGQLLNNASSNVPAVLSSISQVKQIAAGDKFVLALNSNGQVNSWGYNNIGQLGNGSTISANTPKTVSGLSNINIIQIAAGSAHGAALKSTGEVVSWGSNSSGQFGSGTTWTSSYSTTPVTAINLSGVRYISAGGGSTLAIKQDDSLWTWGSNNNGQFGHADTNNRLTPTAVQLGHRVSHGYAGSGNAVFITDYDMNVYGAGANGNAQLGTGGSSNLSQFTIGLEHSIASYSMRIQPSVTLVNTSIYADNYSSSSFLIENGYVYGWGANSGGQLGMGGTAEQRIPAGLNISNVKMISSGADHTLALLNDGTVRAWGQNDSGQLGTGNNNPHSTPVSVLNLSGVKQVAAGAGFSVALMIDGTVRTWGVNDVGQLGVGYRPPIVSPFPVTDLQNVRQIATGADFVLAVLNDGTVRSWGNNGSGQLGLGNTSSKVTPTIVPSLSGVDQVFAGSGHAFAKMADGTVKAWGLNSSGQLGLGNYSNLTTPTTVPGIQNVTKLDAGYSFTLALLDDGGFMAWGDAGMGLQATPGYVSDLFEVADIAAGRGHAMALTKEGMLYTWGDGSSGQLGTGDTYNRVRPKSVSRLAEIVDISAGSGLQSMAVTQYGTLYAWGENIFGNLGPYSPTSWTAPTKFEGIDDVLQVSVSPTHTLALLSNGSVMGWGLSDSGQIGPGFAYSPTLIPGLDNVKQVVASGSISLALMQDGSVKSWGSNYIGQLGLNDQDSRSSPTTIPGLTGVKQIASNGLSTAALMSDGTVKVWGSSADSILGLGGAGNQLFPMQVPGLTGVKQVAVGSQYMLALRNNGTVYAWGANDAGMLGLSDTNPRSMPTQIQGLSQVSQVIAGARHAFALREDGTVMTWGDNSNGQLGTGDLTKRISPTQIEVPGHIVKLSAGHSHTLALLEDGTLLAWGYKLEGALGDPIGTKVPKPINRYFVNTAFVNATIEGPIGDQVSVSYRLDDETSPREYKIASLYGGSATVMFEIIDRESLSTGMHTLKITANTVHQSAEASTTFFNGNGMARETIHLSSITSAGFTVSGVTEDSASVLNANPYRLSVGTQSSGWLPYSSSGAIYSFVGLKPDTKYTIKLDIKSLSGEIRTVTKEVFTLAATPSVALQQAEGQVPKLVITDTNPISTKYQFISDTKYLTSEGRWATQPTNITLPSKALSLMNLDPKKSYTIKVRAINQEGVPTNWAYPIHVGPPVIPPASPKNIKLQPTSTAMLVSWSPVSEATGYEVETDNAATPIPVGKALSYRNSDLTPNTLHQYRIRAVKDGVAGPWSAPVMQRTLMVAPVVPVNIVAIATAKTATVTWNAVSGAFSYEVEWDGHVVAVGKQLMFKQGDLPLGSRHAFRVRALNAGGAGPWSAMQFITTASTLPAVPVTDTPTISNKSVHLRWQSALDALGYEVESDGITVSVDEATTAAFTGLTPGTNHQYRVRAINELGAGSWSAYINVTTHQLGTPTIIAETVADTSIQLQWTSVTGSTSYEVEVDGQVSNTSMSHVTFDTLTPESMHTYRIRAIGLAGNSAWTEPLHLTTLPLKPAIPQHISATASKDQVFLSWGAVSGALGYDVELDGAVVVDNFEETSYGDRLLDPFTEHHYRIRARTDAIEGEWSELISLRTLPEKPAIPSDIVVTSAANIVTLAWAPDATVTKYEIEIDGQVQDAGNKSSFKHRRVAQGSEHKYRIRTINVSGVGDWSGYIINNTIVAKLTKMNTVDLGMVGKDIMDFSRYTLKVTYDPNAVEITDLSTLTGSKELTPGRIAGTDVIVASFRPGEAVFTCDKALALNESWTGVINSIQMKAKVSGGSSITYSVIEQPN